MPLKLFQGEGDYPVGFCARYHDIDRPDHPEWITVVATSRSYREGDARSYGTCLLIGDPWQYFEADDLRTRRIARLLESAGLEH